MVQLKLTVKFTVHQCNCKLSMWWIILLVKMTFSLVMGGWVYLNTIVYNTLNPQNANWKYTARFEYLLYYVHHDHEYNNSLVLQPICGWSQNQHTVTYKYRLYNGTEGSTGFRAQHKPYRHPRAKCKGVYRFPRGFKSRRPLGFII